MFLVNNLKYEVCNRLPSVGKKKLDGYDTINSVNISFAYQNLMREWINFSVLVKKILSDCLFEELSLSYMEPFINWCEKVRTDLVKTEQSKSGNVFSVGRLESSSYRSWVVQVTRERSWLILKWLSIILIILLSPPKLMCRAFA